MAPLLPYILNFNFVRVLLCALWSLLGALPSVLGVFLICMKIPQRDAIYLHMIPPHMCSVIAQILRDNERRTRM